MNYTFQLLEDEYENGSTGEKVKGYSIIVDGKLRETLDSIIALSPEYTSYPQVLGQAISNGILEILHDIRR